LDQLDAPTVANFPLYFLAQCSQHMGYEIQGNWSEQTPYLNLQEGAFTEEMPILPPVIEKDAAAALSKLIRNNTIENIGNVTMNAHTRFQLIEWYVAFLQNHTQHMGNIRSLPVLQAILH